MQQRVASCPLQSIPDKFSRAKTDESTDIDKNKNKNSRKQKETSVVDVQIDNKKITPLETNSNTVHGLEFHFDKDEEAAEKDSWVHPEYSTATYLDAKMEGFPPGGAPLIVFNTRSEDDEEGEEEEEGDQGDGDDTDDDSTDEDGEEDDDDDDNDDDDGDSNNDESDSDDMSEGDEAPDLIDIAAIQKKQQRQIRLVIDMAEEEDDDNNPQTPPCSWIIYPRKNRHAVFPGNLLHGVAGELLQPSLLLSGLNDTMDNNKYVRDLKNDEKNKNNHNNRNDNVRDGENYNYSRLSLLVNIWVSHRPVAVKRMDYITFQKNLKDQIKHENLGKIMDKKKFSEKKTIGGKQDFPNKNTNFNFKKFYSDLESNGKFNPCMIFCPKIPEMYNDKRSFISKKNEKVLGIKSGMKNGFKQKRNLEMIEEERQESLKFSGTKCRLKKRKLQVEVEEMIDDGVIRAVGDGKNIQNVRNCSVCLTGPRSGIILSGVADGINTEIISADIQKIGEDTEMDSDRDAYGKISKDGDKNTKYDNHISKKEIQQLSQITNRVPDPLYFFNEHRSGDTAPVPLLALQEEFYKDYQNNNYKINRSNNNYKKYKNNNNNCDKIKNNNCNTHNVVDDNDLVSSPLTKSKIIKVNYSYN